ncbi:hypothetical protein K438DRAFT_2024706 [Mycena galopus ATCC 62051]|nr:hypothetical protein K438DRAFT_2024706 [Mycena galopus ATCC 62051]
MDSLLGSGVAGEGGMFFRELEASGFPLSTYRRPPGWDVVTSFTQYDRTTAQAPGLLSASTTASSRCTSWAGSLPGTAFDGAPNDSRHPLKAGGIRPKQACYPCSSSLNTRRVYGLAFFDYEAGEGLICRSAFGVTIAANLAMGISYNDFDQRQRDAALFPFSPTYQFC